MAETKRRRDKKKRTGRKHSSLKRAGFYNVSGAGFSRTVRFCSRCPAGTILAQHTNRLYCGRCGYTEFLKKSDSPAASGYSSPNK